ncbi:DUF938 domain-containing protein [Maricaulis sp. D1M11]|uniref:DUF938 domain-containing protein n=1 Tax=Maricaulis sp. D1M11 TaxID=3076117 RepID=UPI0039B4AC03
MSDTPLVRALETRLSEGDRLQSPSAARNRAVIAETLAQFLPPRARVVEIGSGTGEHAVSICRARPDLVWQPSDIDEAARRSQTAWSTECPGQIAPSVEIDASAERWSEELGPIDAIFSANVIHISPWAVAEGLAREGGRVLPPGGRLCLYGPFLNGADTAPSNLAFDESLKSRDPAWGVRDRQTVIDLMAQNGLESVAVIEMPANNHMLVFERRDG